MFVQLRAAKLASPDDASTHSALQEATQAVNDTVGDLLKLCDTTNPGQRELSSALEVRFCLYVCVFVIVW